MPIITLRATTVGGLPVLAGRRTDYYDTVVPGLVLRVTPAGARTWAVKYSVRNRNERYTIGGTELFSLAEARAEARRVRALVALGKDPLAERRQARQRGLTVGELAEQCLASDELAALRPTTRRDYTRLVAREIKPRLGSRPAGALATEDVMGELERIKARAPITALHVQRLLHRIYSWGLGKRLVAASPLAGVPPVASAQQRDRVLSAEEIVAVWRACDLLGAPYGEAVQLLLLTLARESMVLGMRSEELVLDAASPRWVLPAERMKGRRPHVVPLAPQAVALIRRRLDAGAADQQQCLFPAPNTSGHVVWSDKVSRRLRALAEQQLGAPMAHWTIHGLRHAGSTHLRKEFEVGRDVVALLLSHQVRGGGDATARYDRSELLGARRAALVAWAAWIERRVSGAEGGAQVVPLRAPRENNSLGAGSVEGVGSVPGAADQPRPSRAPSDVSRSRSAV